MYLKVLQLSAQTLTELLLFFNDTKGRNLIYYLLDYCIRLTKMASLPNYVHKTHTCFLPYRFCCVHCVHDIRKVYSVKPTCGQGFLPQRSLVLRKVNYHQSYIVWRLMHEWRLKLSRFHYSDWLRNHKRNHWQFCKLTAFLIAISISIKYCTWVLYVFNQEPELAAFNYEVLSFQAIEFLVRKLQSLLFTSMKRF